MRDPHVLQKLPCRMRTSFYFFSPQSFREVLDDRIKIEVRSASSQHEENVFANGLVGIHGTRGYGTIVSWDVSTSNGFHSPVRPCESLAVTV